MTPLEIAGLIIAGLAAAYFFACLCAEAAFRLAAPIFEQDPVPSEAGSLSDRDSINFHGETSA